MMYVFYICVEIHHYPFEYRHKNQVLKRLLFWDRGGISMLITCKTIVTG
jgi:hypothetical protein